MNAGPQDQILSILREGRPVKSEEFIRRVLGWDHRKAISRLRRQGWDILSEIRPGDRQATYTLRAKQERLFRG